MASDKSKNSDYRSITSAKKSGKSGGSDYPSIVRTKKNENTQPTADFPVKVLPEGKGAKSENSDLSKQNTDRTIAKAENLSYSEQKKLENRTKKIDRDTRLLQSDRWIIRNGHTLTFAGIYLFSFFVFFRPYELIPGFGFLSSGAFIIAAATLTVYLPTQFAAEGNLTVFNTEIKCVLAMTVLALALMPITRDVGTAWATFNDIFVKAVLIFIIMVNAVRTRKRLMALVWLSLGISVYLSYNALVLYQKGVFNTEGYRVSVDVKGLFENANEMSLHLVTMIPIGLALGLAAKNRFLKAIYYFLALLFIAANFVTFSRGGFLGFVAAMVVFGWKIGRSNRFKTIAVSSVIGLITIILVPGNYGIRMLSIFFPGLDPVGSSDLRKENLILSLIATARNPWGIGIGNSVTFGVYNLQTHNAYTQVSSELGLLGFAAYIIFMVSPFRKLGAIERTLFGKNERDWFYFLAIGLQASIVGYMVSSFFASVAYNWFIYYLIAYAVAFRRIYGLEKGVEIQAESLKEKILSFRTA